MLRLVLHVPRMTGPRSDELERYPRSDRFQRTSQAIGRWRMRDEGQEIGILEDESYRKNYEEKGDS